MRSVLHSLVLGILIGSMACPAALVAQQPVKPATKPDFRFITPDSVVIAIAHPGRLAESGYLDALPHEVITAFGMRDLGFDPMDIETITIVVEPSQGLLPLPNSGIVIQMRNKLEQEKLFPKIQNELEEVTDPESGQKIMIASGPYTPGYAVFGDKTLVIGNRPMLNSLLAAVKQGENPNRDAISNQYQGHDLQAFFQIEPIRDFLKGALEESGLPSIPGISQVPDELDTIKLQFSIINKTELSLELVGKDEKAAKHLKQIIELGINLGEQMAMKEFNKMLRSEDVVEQAQGKYQTRVMKQIIESLKLETEGNTVRIAYPDDGTGPQLASIAVVGVLVAFLLPELQLGRGASRRMSSVDNLKQIGIAAHNYHDTFNGFPAQAITDKEGNPLLSWRVALLPFIEYNNLYDQFHLDEPWNSEHNIKLIALMPEVYKNPSSKANPGLTQYLAPVGKWTLWEDNKKRKFRDILDGSSNSIMILEVNDEASVIWSKPEDLNIDFDNPLQGLGSAQPAGFSALFCDGSVHQIKPNINQETFKLLLKIRDGKVVPDF
ncbi:MAG: hypothetical protein COA78_21680 [Blastopirellula sp.]|nr:MAG: hypothetical protein COA78_21680 [Blastopirellula sp.]